ncbi:MAG: FAD-binding protein, partial [Gemmatimonadota bacterium]|nr:FAD-binding protein [Gemmatimonadota bacterium]
DSRAPGDIPEEERDYYLERKYPSFGNLAPRDISSRSAKEACDDGRGIGSTGLGVYLDFRDAIGRLGEDTIRARYGNLFHMYRKITGENPYETPMRIYPASHYTMGGLWVDYNLMSTIDGLFVIGEANFSDHGANRLGASALMQGLADGYFVLPYTIGNYFARMERTEVTTDHAECRGAVEEATARIDALLGTGGKETPDSFHRRLGQIVWEHCGMARNDAGLAKAQAAIPALREEFRENLLVCGTGNELNMNLEAAGRVADFLEFAELMVTDARARTESCGGHFREESQTEEGEAARDDENFCHASVWEHRGAGETPVHHREPLVFEHVELSQRSYK